jgi:hypothetical protein
VRETATHLQRVHIVGEDDNLVTPIFMVLDQELARLELVWVHAVQKHSFPRLLPQILSIEFWGHWAPNFRTLIEQRVSVALFGCAFLSDKILGSAPERWQCVP